MNISSELQKLASLRDSGDLSQAEFEKAKTILLNGENAPSPSTQNATADVLAEKTKERKAKLAVAILLTVTLALSLASACINPSPIKLVLVILWAVAAGLAWPGYFKVAKEINELQKT